MAKLGIVERRWRKTLYNSSGDECESVYVISSTTKRASNRRLLRRWKNLVTKTVLGWQLIKGNMDDEAIAKLDIKLVGMDYEEQTSD